MDDTLRIPIIGDSGKDKDGRFTALVRREDALDGMPEVRAVIEAASALKFGAYPAHGSGYVLIVTEGNVDALRAAITALDRLRAESRG